MRAPSEDYIAAVMKILSYVKFPSGRGLIFLKHGHLEDKGYIDADWASNITHRCSTSRFVGGNMLTHLDIAYATRIVSQFMHAPSEDYIAAMMGILSYVKSSFGRRFFHQ